jgi:hypothetical protein
MMPGYSSLTYGEQQNVFLFQYWFAVQAKLVIHPCGGFKAVRIVILQLGLIVCCHHVCLAYFMVVALAFSFPGELGLELADCFLLFSVSLSFFMLFSCPVASFMILNDLSLFLSLEYSLPFVFSKSRLFQNGNMHIKAKLEGSKHVTKRIVIGVMLRYN